jgi:predicted permease
MRQADVRTRAGERLYSLLLRLYPRAFREACGAELLGFFRARAMEARYRGWSGRLKLWRSMLLDLMVSVPKEHSAVRSARRIAKLAERTVSGKEGALMSWIREDARQAARAFVRSPGFVLATVATLGLGIGATTTMFGVVDGVVLRALPYPEADRLVQIGSRFGEVEVGAVSIPDFFDLMERNRTFEAMSTARLQSMDAAGEGEPEQFLGAGVTASYFDVLDVRPFMGRAFGPETDRRGGGEATVVLSHGVWQRRFGGDPSILGRTIRLNDTPFRIIGIMPREFRGPGAIYHEDADLWFPLGYIEDELDNRGDAFVQLIGRLKDDVTLEAASADLQAVGEALGRAYPADGVRNYWVASLQARTVGDSGQLLWILFGAVSLLLLIACANVANLFLVRATERTREMAVRAAIGAGRGRIARQLLTESTLIALAGGLIGAVLAFGGVGLFRATGPADLPRLAEVTVDARVLAFALGLSMLTGLVFGIAPAFDAMRTGLSSGLRDVAGNITGGRVRMRLRNALVVAQTTLALVLLVGAGLLANSLMHLTRVDPGFDPANVVWLNVRLPERSYESAESRLAFYDEMMRRVRNVSGVQSAGAIHGRPLDRNNSIATMLPEGPVPADPEQAPRFSFHSVTPGYFGTLGTPLIDGRDVRETDVARGPRVAVISRSMAERFWPGQRAVGKRFWMGQIGNEAALTTVIGVVDDVLHYGLSSPPSPMVYRPVTQIPRNWLGVIVRHTGREPSALIRELREIVWTLDSTLPLDEYGTMQDHVRASIGEPRFRALALSAFSVIAAVLAFVGLYATLAWVVRTRRRELGIRMALGAAGRDVQRMVIARGMLLAGSGIALGTAGAIGASRVLSSMMFGVTTTDVTTFVLVAAGMAFMAFLASWIPARRAAATDPARTLRSD